jgi:hypothetical protein
MQMCVINSASGETAWTQNNFCHDNGTALNEPLSYHPLCTWESYTLHFHWIWDTSYQSLPVQILSTYIYIYRYMTYMGFQICVSTHGDLRLKMSKQVRSIWKISIHLNSLFIFPSPHENNDYSITFLDQSAPNPPGVPRLTLGVGANVAEGHPFNSLHGEHSRLGQWGSSQRWCLNEKDVFPCLKLKNPI